MNPYRINRRGSRPRYFKTFDKAERAWQQGDVLWMKFEGRWRMWTSAGLI